MVRGAVPVTGPQSADVHAAEPRPAVDLARPEGLHLFHQLVQKSDILLENFRAGETGLLRLTWDNGDRTVLVNPELGGMTLGWNLMHGPEDELFAAIEGTAFHTRVILERMEEHGVPIARVINGGGIPQKNETLNRVYANVLNKPVLVPESEVTSLGAAIFA